jgi:hypothetical protein
LIRQERKEKRKEKLLLLSERKEKRKEKLLLLSERKEKRKEKLLLSERKEKQHPAPACLGEVPPLLPLLQRPCDASALLPVQVPGPAFGRRMKCWPLYHVPGSWRSGSRSTGNVSQPASQPRIPQHCRQSRSGACPAPQINKLRRKARHSSAPTLRYRTHHTTLAAVA